MSPYALAATLVGVLVLGIVIGISLRKPKFDANLLFKKKMSELLATSNDLANDLTELGKAWKVVFGSNPIEPPPLN